MAAPVFGTAGTYLGGTDATSAAVPVPASVAAGDIILVGIYKETTAAITPPAGFTQCTNSPVATTGSVSQLSVFWKRATGADTGTYTFSWTGTAYSEATSLRVTGGLSTGDPTEVNSFAQVSAATVTSPAVSGTTASADRLLVWFGTNFDGGGQVTAPSGFTGRDGHTSGATPGTIASATKAQPIGGATGSVTATWNISSVLNAGLVAILPDSGGATVSEYARPPRFSPGLIAPNGLLLPVPRGDATAVPNSIPSAAAATGTGQAFDVVVSIAPGAGNAAGTGSAGNTTVSTTGSTQAPAGNAGGTGAANNATVASSTAAGNASGTGAAGAPTPNPGPAADNAAGIGSAGAATDGVAASAGLASGTGAANNAAGSIVGPPPDTYQAGFATAPMFYSPARASIQLAGDTSPVTAGSTSVQAGSAAGTGTANQPAVTVSTSTGSAAGTGAASSATVSVSTAAGNAAGTGAASTASTTTVSNASAGLAAGTGAANTASVSTTGSQNAQAGAAAGTGAANAPAPTAAPVAGNAAGTGAANSPRPNTGVAAGVATGTGAANAATITTPNAAAGNAAGVGAAYPATVSTSRQATAGVATGTGTARSGVLVLAIIPATAAGFGAGRNTTNGVPVVLYPIRSGVIADRASHQTAGAVTDEVIHYRAGTSL